MSEVEVITLAQGAELLLFERWLSADERARLFDALLAEIPWAERSIVIMGKAMLQPRLVAWIGDPEAVYTYSGARNVPGPWTPALLDLRRRLETELGTLFNSVLANLYRDGQDSMGFHADKEPELGPEPLIASVSLGATRRFQLRPVSKNAPGLDLDLPGGSLLVMRGTTQRHYRHGVPKQRTPVGPRINLTFRNILPRR